MRVEAIENWMSRAYVRDWNINSNRADFERLHEKWSRSRGVYNPETGEKRPFGTGPNESVPDMLWAAAACFNVSEWFPDEWTMTLRSAMIAAGFRYPDMFEKSAVYGESLCLAAERIEGCRSTESPLYVPVDEALECLLEFPELEREKDTYKFVNLRTAPEGLSSRQKMAWLREIRRLGLGEDAEYITQVAEDAGVPGVRLLMFLQQLSDRFLLATQRDEWDYCPLSWVVPFLRAENWHMVARVPEMLNRLREFSFPPQLCGEVLDTLLPNRKYWEFEYSRTGDTAIVWKEVRRIFRSFFGITNAEYDEVIKTSAASGFASLQRDLIGKAAGGLPEGAPTPKSVDVARWFRKHKDSRYINRTRTVYGPAGTRAEFTLLSKLDEITDEDLVNGLKTAPEVAFRAAAERAERQAALSMGKDVPLAKCPLGDPPDGFVIQILSSEKLKEEGKIMNHCVGGYVNAAAQGRTFIYHYGDKAPSGATVEIYEKGGRFVVGQMFGYGDSHVPSADRSRVEKWVVSRSPVSSC